MLLSSVVVVLLCLAVAYAMPYDVPLQGSAGGKRTLVLLDNLEKTTHFSLFFKDLTTRGHQLTFRHHNSESLELKVYGETQFDNILFFAPSTDSFQKISFDDISEFVQEGGNLLLAASRDISESVRDLAAGFGVQFDKKGMEVIDHFENDASLDSSRQHVTVQSKNAVDSKAILGSFHGKSASQPVLFRGIAQKLNKESILAVPVLSGNPTSYSHFPNRPQAEAADLLGAQATLVSAVQGRNNARVVISGSLDLFSNEFFSVGQGNREFAREVSKWGFREAGVLRFRDIVHHKTDGSPPDVILHEKERPDLPVTLYPDPEITRNSLVYRIKDEIVYSMIVEELVNGQWQPFVASDMQMEFVMLDAYVLKTMTPDAATGRFACTFTAPDSYGVFKFRVLYRRLGYSVLHAETQVSIRPFKHNEYERFIFSAYPYYASAFSATIALFVFSMFFLFSSEK